MFSNHHAGLSSKDRSYGSGGGKKVKALMDIAGSIQVG